MDKTRIVILGVGIAVLAAFSVYNFIGSFPSNIPNSGSKIQPVNTVNPASNTTETKNNSTQPVQHPDSNNTNIQNVFENRDKIENYYSISFPADAEVVHGNNAGSYVVTTNGGVFTAALQDIPDDTTVQLYVLTHDEPKLKSSVQDYKQISFNQLTVANHRAWNLVYTWANGTGQLASSRTYVEGPDEAMVIEFTAPSQQYAQHSSAINAVIERFRWIG